MNAMELLYGGHPVVLPPSAGDWAVLGAGSGPEHGAGGARRSAGSDVRGSQVGGSGERKESAVRGAAEDAAEWVGRRFVAGERLALVVPDRTRPLPLPDLLPVVLDALEQQGVEATYVDLVPASGMHRPMSLPELRAWVGEEVCRRGVGLYPHDARGETVALGETPNWIPVRAHRKVARAAAVLVLGRIVFHYLAGYGGGRKMLVPGVSGIETILAVHSRCLATGPARGRHLQARAGVLEGNPVHEAACEAARLFPPSIAIHIALDEKGHVAEATAGDLFADHEAVAERYGRDHLMVVERPVQAMIVSAGGHPLDRNLVQSHKALDAVVPVVEEGGIIVLLARCEDGVGNPEIEEGLRLRTPEAIEAELRRNFRVGVHTALALVEKTRRFQVLAVTDLNPEILELAGIEKVDSLQAAAARIVERFGSEARVAMAPRGGSLLYQLARSA